MTYYDPPVDPSDPLGWQQIAAALQAQQGQGGGGGWNPNGLPPELLYALAGNITPIELGDIQAQGGLGAAQAAQPMDPGQAFVESYGQDYLGQAAAFGEQSGLFEQRPYYWHDDLQELENILSKRGTAAAEAQYDISQDELENQIDQSRLGLAQGAAARDERSLNAELGSVDADRMYLESEGITGEGLLAELAEDPNLAYESIAQLLPMTDQYGQPWNAHPGGVNRMMAIVQSYMDDQDNAAAQAQQAMDPATLQVQRWGQLNQDERAKEIFLNQQQPGVRRTVAPGGGVHYGPDAEQQIASGYRGTTGRAATRFLPSRASTPQGRLERARYSQGINPSGRRPGTGKVRTVEDVRAGRPATGTGRPARGSSEYVRTGRTSSGGRPSSKEWKERRESTKGQPKPKRRKQNPEEWTRGGRPPRR